MTRDIVWTQLIKKLLKIQRLWFREWLKSTRSTSGGGYCVKTIGEYCGYCKKVGETEVTWSWSLISFKKKSMENHGWRLAEYISNIYYT